MGRIRAGLTPLSVVAVVALAGCDGGGSEAADKATPTPETGALAAGEQTPSPQNAAATIWCAALYAAVDHDGFLASLGKEPDPASRVGILAMNAEGPTMVCMGDGIVVSALDATDEGALQSWRDQQDEWNAEFPADPIETPFGDGQAVYLSYTEGDATDMEFQAWEGLRATSVSLLIEAPGADEDALLRHVLELSVAAREMPLPPVAP